MRLYLLIFIFLTLLGPLALLFSNRIDFAADYRTANRDSAKLAPDPAKVSDAVIQIYSARAFNWRGIFAVHTWIAIKEKDAKHYMVYQVVGWRLLSKLPPLVTMQDAPDRNWFNQKPNILLDIRGKKAEELIPKINAAIRSYPYPNEYITWPGPNSNTFVAYVGRQVPELQLNMPSNAVGKDYLLNTQLFASAVSGTGYQISLYGILGVTLALQEGLEINFLGLVYGINPLTLTLKLPGFGDIKLFS